MKGLVAARWCKGVYYYRNILSTVFTDREIETKLSLLPALLQLKLKELLLSNLVKHICTNVLQQKVIHLR